MLVGYGVRGQDHDVYHRAFRSLGPIPGVPMGSLWIVHSSGRYDEGAGVEHCRLSN